MDNLAALYHDQHGVPVTHLDFLAHAVAQAEPPSSPTAEPKRRFGAAPSLACMSSLLQIFSTTSYQLLESLLHLVVFQVKNRPAVMISVCGIDHKLSEPLVRIQSPSLSQQLNHSVYSFRVAWNHNVSWRLTTRITDPAPVVSDIEPRRYPRFGASDLLGGV